MSKPIMRDGDIEALRNRTKDEGRPIRSQTIRRGDKTQRYEIRKDGRVRTTEID